MNTNQISVFQKNWAFTSADSTKPQLKTGTFGPCYVVCFTTDKYAVLAHIDDATQVNSIVSIFNKFKEHSIDFKAIKVNILGGWKDNPSSFLYGCKLVALIKEAGFGEVITKLMFSKMTLNLNPVPILTLAEAKNYYHGGVLIDSIKGKNFLVDGIDLELEREQYRQSELFDQKYGNNPPDLPLTQITE